MKLRVLVCYLVLQGCTESYKGIDTPKAFDPAALTDFTSCGHNTEVDLTGPNGDKTVTISWAQPLLFENGTALVQSEIDSFYIHWQEETGLTSGEYIVEGYIDELDISGLMAGSYDFTVCSKTVYGTVSLPIIISRSL